MSIVYHCSWFFFTGALWYLHFRTVKINFVFYYLLDLTDSCFNGYNAFYSNKTLDYFKKNSTVTNMFFLLLYSACWLNLSPFATRYIRIFYWPC